MRILSRTIPEAALPIPIALHYSNRVSDAVVVFAFAKEALGRVPSALWGGEPFPESYSSCLWIAAWSVCDVLFLCVIVSLHFSPILGDLPVLMIQKRDLKLYDLEFQVVT